MSQSFERNENGGLTSASIENYESEDPIFDERSKLNVKFEDAKNNYQQRIFYLKNNFMLSNKKITLLTFIMFLTLKQAIIDIHKITPHSTMGVQPRVLMRLSIITS